MEAIEGARSNEGGVRSFEGISSGLGWSCSVDLMK